MGKFLHCLVARDTTVLCEFTSPGVTFQRIDKERLKAVADKAQKDGVPKQTLPEGDRTHHFLCNTPYGEHASHVPPPLAAQPLIELPS